MNFHSTPFLAKNCLFHGIHSVYVVLFEVVCKFIMLMEYTEFEYTIEFEYNNLYCSVSLVRQRNKQQKNEENSSDNFCHSYKAHVNVLQWKRQYIYLTSNLAIDYFFFFLQIHYLNPKKCPKIGSFSCQLQSSIFSNKKSFDR